MPPCSSCYSHISLTHTLLTHSAAAISNSEKLQRFHLLTFTFSMSHRHKSPVTSTHNYKMWNIRLSVKNFSDQKNKYFICAHLFFESLLHWCKGFSCTGQCADNPEVLLSSKKVRKPPTANRKAALVNRAALIKWCQFTRAETVGSTVTLCPCVLTATGVYFSLTWCHMSYFYNQPLRSFTKNKLQWKFWKFRSCFWMFSNEQFLVSDCWTFLNGSHELFHTVQLLWIVTLILYGLNVKIYSIPR